MNKRVFLINLIIVLSVIISVGFYLRQLAQDQQDENINSHIHDSFILEDIASNYLENTEALCKSWKEFIDTEHYTMEEAMKHLAHQTEDSEMSAHLIFQKNLQGISSVPKAKDKNDYSVSYEKNKELFHHEEEKRDVYITPSYINPIDGSKVVSFFCYVTLADEKGKDVDAILLNVIPEEIIKKNWTFPSNQSEAVSIGLIHVDGSYLLKSDIMEEENFYQFLYKYNKELIDVDEFATDVRENEMGIFAVNIAGNEEWVWTYHHLENNPSWILISGVPSVALDSVKIQLVIPCIIFVAMLLILLIDILTYRDIQKKTLKNTEELSVALEGAERANRSKTIFLNNMSHDIRTPMNAIIGFADLARRNVGNKAKTQEYLSKIMMSGNHLLSLINDILDMSRIESGRVELEEEKVNLPELIYNISDILQADIAEHELNFHVELMSLKDDNVWCDKLKLDRILLNILGNAVKFTKQGGEISLTVRQLSEESNDKATYEIRVKDNGIGISKEFCERIFEPFERAESSTVNGIQGTGLGMTITKSYIDMMGGTISVESELGKGSEFIVKLSFKKIDSVNSNEKLPEQESKKSVRGKRIMLVDDNELNCEIAKTLLEEEGCVVEVAHDGTEVVEQMKKQPPGTYDLIFMDIQMPVMNGYEATREIRALELEEQDKLHTPIVAMTANAFVEDVEESLQVGMDAHLAKPASKNAMIEMIRRFS